MSRLATIALVLVGCGRDRFGAGGDAAGAGGDVSGDAATGPPSCAGLAPNCGPGSNVSCCDSPIITGGTFYRGYDLAFDGIYPDMSAPATVSTFAFDRYEVTVGRFRKFVDAGMGTQLSPPPAGAGARTLNGTPGQGGWDPAWNAILPADLTALHAALACDTTATWTDAPGSNENLPITCVNWYEAMAFCAWDGGYLPTEAEAMYADGGGSLQRAYPWSAPAYDVTIDCGHANYNNTCVAATRDVGLDPSGYGVWGQADLAGNAWEWALDWGNGAFPVPCTDCAYLTGASYRVINGGSYFNSADFLRSASRHYDSPDIGYGNSGVRCARPAP